MAFRIHRGVWQFKKADGAYESKYKLNDSGQLVETDADGNEIGGMTASVAWTSVSGRPTTLSSFTNDLGNYGGWLTTGGKAADSNLLDGIDSGSFLRSDASDDLYGTLTVHSGGANSYGRIRGYGNDNHFIVIRGSVSTGTSTLTITGAHRTTFVEHAEANDTTGWYFVSKQTGSYTEVARITRVGITAPGYNNSNWDTAYGWGNHSTRGYLTSESDTLATVTGRGSTTSSRIYADNGVHVRGDWVRVNGTTGIYFESYGGGWNMTDSSWIRAYNNKNIYTGGKLEVGGSLRADSGIHDANVRFMIPGNAYSVNNPSGTGGAIKIEMPTSVNNNNTMMSMTVQVYEYSTGNSFTLRCGGYNYYTGDWYNVFATMLSDSGKGGDVPVYFGNDGSRNIIWIGNSDWSWSYPNVFVTDFQAGHTQNENWKSGWRISFDTAARTNVSASRTAYRQIDAGNIGSQSVNYATTAGSAPANGGNADTVDGWHRDDLRAWGNLTGVPSTFTPSSHTHDDRYYTESESLSLFARKDTNSAIGGNLVIGNGTYGNATAYGNSGARLMFSGSDTDAQGNYYIGTNHENYGGNYSKLDLRWHTGIRMGAQPGYGGIRFYNNEDFGARIMSIGESDGNVRIDNNLWIGGAGGWITDLLAGKQAAGSYAAASHTHDDRYYTESEVDSLLAGKAASSHSHSYLPLGGGTLTGQLNMHAGAYEGSIVFGSTSTWRTGIRQHDDADAELRIWAKNPAGMIFLATGYDGEPASISRPTDGLAIQNNRLGIGDFSAGDPSYKLHVKGTGYFSDTLTLTNISGAAQTVPNTYGAYLHLGTWGDGRTAAGAVLVNTAYRADYATSLFDMNISRFTNNSGYITANGATGANGNFYIDDNYGYGIVGAYSSTRYQGVFAMGDSYKLPADGSGTGTLYGIAWTHTNVGGESKSGLGHQALFMMNGRTYTAIGSGIWTDGTITTTSHGNSSQWNTAYGWGNHASAGYAASSHNHDGVYQPAGSYAAASHTHAISDVTGLQGALDGKQAAGSYAASNHNHTYNVNDDWLRENGDNANFKIYGNSRSVIYRTDGVTNEHGGGGYPHIWYYGGSADGNRVMIINTSGQLWMSNYGWLHDYFQRAGSYAAASHTHAISEVTGLQGALDGKQAAGSYAASSHTHTPSQVGLGNVSNAAQVTTSYNSSLNSDSRNSRGVTRLYRRDSDSDYSVQNHWTGSYWYMRGYSGDNFHAEVQVGYANSAGSASSATSATSASTATNLSGGNVTTSGNNLYIYNSGAENYRLHHNGAGGVFDSHAQFAIRPASTDFPEIRYILNDWVGYFWYNVDPWGDNWGIGPNPYSWAFVNRGNMLTFGFEDWSDRRHKSAITEIDNAVDKVKAISGYTYWKRGSEVREGGVIAQDVLEVFPEAVGGSEEGYSIKPSALIGLLSKAVKEQQEMIDALTARIEALENK